MCQDDTAMLRQDVLLLHHLLQVHQLLDVFVDVLQNQDVLHQDVNPPSVDARQDVMHVVQVDVARHRQ
jgi:hypothetical protein